MTAINPAPSQDPLRIGLLGTGSHCRREHLPALQAYRDRHRGNCTLQAVCDLDEASAREVAADLGFAAVYTDLESMLNEENLQAIIAVTPTPATAAVAQRIMTKGIPLLMEKPLGINLKEARAVVETHDKTNCPVTVGLNRRFDPVLVKAREWVKGRDIRSFLVRLHRKNRREQGFVADVIPHPLDFLSSVLGSLEIRDVVSHGRDCGESFTAWLQSENHGHGILECLPDAGLWRESYAFSGPGFLLEADSLCRCKGVAQDEQPFLYERVPGVEGGATYGETTAFLEGVRAGRLPGPDPAAVLQTMCMAGEIESAINS